MIGEVLLYVIAPNRWDIQICHLHRRQHWCLTFYLDITAEDTRDHNMGVNDSVSKLSIIYWLYKLAPIVCDNPFNGCGFIMSFEIAWL